jgi:hypothetical protein
MNYWILFSLKFMSTLSAGDVVINQESYRYSSDSACVYNVSAFCINDFDFKIENYRINEEGLVEFSLYERPFPHEPVTIIHPRTCNSVRSNTLRMVGYIRNYRRSGIDSLLVTFRLNESGDCDLTLISPLDSSHLPMMGFAVAIGQIRACPATSCAGELLITGIPMRLSLFGTPR